VKDIVVFMGFDHLVREEDSVIECLYCGKDLNKREWDSEFCGMLHYKIIECECGKKNRVKHPTLGSGHDNFNDDKNLEVRVGNYRFAKFDTLPPPN